MRSFRNTQPTGCLQFKVDQKGIFDLNSEDFIRMCFKREFRVLDRDLGGGYPQVFGEKTPPLIRVIIDQRIQRVVENLGHFGHHSKTKGTLPTPVPCRPVWHS